MHNSQGHGVIPNEFNWLSRVHVRVHRACLFSRKFYGNAVKEKKRKKKGKNVSNGRERESVCVSTLFVGNKFRGYKVAKVFEHLPRKSFHVRTCLFMRHCFSTVMKFETNLQSA